MTQSIQTEKIEIRLVGEGMSPARLRINDLAEMADAVEDLVQSSVLNIASSDERQSIHLALTAVHDGSAVYGFTPNNPRVVMPAYREMARRVNDDRFDLLSPVANDALSRIARIAQKNNCTAELRTSNSDLRLALVRAETYVPEGAQIQTRTTIYGRVMDAGGKNPNVHVETLQGYSLIFRGSEADVRKLAGLLYEVVGIVATGSFNTLTQQYTNMFIRDVLPYRAMPITAAFRELASVAGPYFDGIDADEYVRRLRSDEDKEE